MLAFADSAAVAAQAPRPEARGAAEGAPPDKLPRLTRFLILAGGALGSWMLIGLCVWAVAAALAA